jgi:hypothetical protein
MSGLRKRARQHMSSRDSQAGGRNLEGTNLNSLDPDDIHIKALEMGVDSSSFTLKHIDCMKNLKVHRHNLDKNSRVA